jgi:hypothetical protein
MLTSEQKQRYIAIDGVRCPYCGEDDLECGGRTFDGNRVRIPVTCLVCDKVWIDVYVLKAIEEVES